MGKLLGKANEMFVINKIIEARKEKNISQAQIAQELGIATSTYQLNENKLAMPLDRVMAVCEILGIDLRDVLTEILEPNKEEKIEKEDTMLTYSPKDLESLNHNMNDRLSAIENTMSQSLSLIADSLNKIAQKMDKDNKKD